MKYLTIPLLALLFLVPPVYAQDSETTLPDIARHDLVVTLVPETHYLVATDIVHLTVPATGEFTFTLNANLVINSISSESEDVRFETIPYEGSGVGETAELEHFSQVRVLLPIGATRFEINYEGEIYDPIDPSTSLGRVRGDYTSGIISPDGVYLSSGSGWYPDTEYAMSAYNVSITLPATWLAVTQGDLASRSSDDEFSYSEWTSDIASDGLVLVANEYVVTTREIAGVECSTYFYQDAPGLSALFLDKLEQYLPAYIELLGPYPYNRFDVVENFFTTGYGMPGFTLLGSMVLRMPFATAEGSLAHELVHNWWGNFVYVDWENGNWCEGITVFCTNYYWSILDGRPEDAERLRFRSMVRYSVEVSGDEDYPVREFRTKFTEIDADIGYGKSSAIFIMLHKMLGKDDFFEALHLCIERYGGQMISWDEWQEVFEDVSGRDLSDFFSTWLDNYGTPVIDIHDIEQTQAEDGNYKLTFDITLAGDMFTFDAPFVLHGENGDLDFFVPLTGPVQHCELMGTVRFQSLEFDPDHLIFRRLSRDEIPPSLNTTMEADSILVVLPSGGDDEFLEISSGGGPPGGTATSQVSVTDHYQSLADQILASSMDVTVMYDCDVTEEDLASNSILCLGNGNQNSIVDELSVSLSESVSFAGQGFEVNGTPYSDDGYSILTTTRNPLNPDYDITFYMGTSPQAVVKASYMFFYGWDSFVVYLDGSPVDRGEWDMGHGPYYYEL